MTTKAYSYIRFSTPEQMKGDSLRRQIELSEKYATEHSLVLDTSLNMRDLGKSAYTGDNIKKGALGAFMKAIEQGKISKGSYLLVESLDRISRQKPRDALRLFLDILSEGIIIVTLADNKKYDNDTIDVMDLMMSLVVMSRAHDESKMKSERIKAAWDYKRDNIENVKFTKWSPKWVYLTDDKKKFKTNDERVKVVQKIYEYSAQGLGTNLIIKKLEEGGIEPWDMGKGIKIEKRKAKRWYPSYIQRITHDRAVLGEYKLSKAKAKEGYDIIENYYPKIISEELFYRVQEARESRNVHNKGGGRKGRYFSNLFSKLAMCGYSCENGSGSYRCAGTNEVMRYINKGGNSRYRYLQCSRVKDGHTGCERFNRMWRYDHFEIAFLTHITDIDVSVLLGSESDIQTEIKALEESISACKGKIEYYKNKIDSLRQALYTNDGLPDFIVEEGEVWQLEEKEEKLKLKELEKTLATKNYDMSNSENVGKHLSDVIQALKEKSGNDLFELRLHLSELLKKHIERIEVFPSGANLDKYFDDIENQYGKPTRDDLESDYIKSNYQSDKYFVVRYKSGELLHIIPNIDDPTILQTMLKVSKDNKLEKIRWKI